ncbi:O-methyltransferase, putative [Talaromyces stipitatus ATCC 10500]|uniref:O-methyltransferase, putative n=1 Tax=Talaromyces stipitatus (strain ATCC 10500 / CBS 375.48 / QM 6759 / NRRL 1006) TaxID=441959 RepID=B8MI70_TALSN|nr:O-methyltransferase, putative [Talaromyces stipitatus ATCC 10500]EED17232.1 O-methyltransferase, putative [Talaromyces stipitatus ATCC 10500]
MANIASNLRSISKESFTSESDRQQAVAEARALITRLESPWETAFRQSWIEPSRMACLEIGNKIGLWDKWVADGSGPKTLEEISKLVTCDYQLLSRIVWQLAGTNLLKVVQPGVFGLTPFTVALGDGPQIASTVPLYFEVQGPALHTLPSYVEGINFQNPTDQVNSSFAKWAKAPLWEWLKEHPDAEKVIGTVMQTYAGNRPTLSQVYPTEKLLNGASGESSVVLVDVGGSLGHDLLSFSKIFDFKPETLVLQDRAPVLENAGELIPAIKKLEYDFFTPQPVEGAAAYYLHFILHDWPDADCKKILSNQKAGMKKGYSKLLLHEVVLDTNEPKETGTSSDIAMMAMVSGMERTEAQWTSLLEESGFKIIQIYSHGLGAESVIEAEIA